MCYVHSPVRYAWDQQFEYLRQARLGYGPKGLLFRYMLHNMRMWDFRTSFGPDLMVANSSHVRERIRRIYGREADVVFPPVDIDEMTYAQHKDDYYVVASYLVPYKRVDLVVRAFNEMPTRRLVVAGAGQQLSELKEMAGPNVTFTGHLARNKFVDVIARAKAFVFAGCEDFGIVMAEAQACGTPLVAFGRGGACDIVRNLGEAEPATGVLFGAQTPTAVKDAVQRFETHADRISAAACRENATRFSVERFQHKIAESWLRTLETKRSNLK
ncbi:MAG: glycosyltransferase, partial [Xanthobacteraceae bacterium]